MAAKLAAVAWHRRVPGVGGGGQLGRQIKPPRHLKLGKTDSCYIQEYGGGRHKS